MIGQPIFGTDVSLKAESEIIRILRDRGQELIVVDDARLVGKRDVIQQPERNRIYQGRGKHVPGKRLV
jgi:hypothetical protein